MLELMVGPAQIILGKSAQPSDDGDWLESGFQTLSQGSLTVESGLVPPRGWGQRCQQPLPVLFFLIHVEFAFNDLIKGVPALGIHAN